MIRNISPEREKIGEAMVWCIEHADAAEEICQMMTESMTNNATALPKKVRVPTITYVFYVMVILFKDFFIA